MELTQLQFGWLCRAFGETGADGPDADQLRAMLPAMLKDPAHPGWQEYDHLQGLANRSDASRI